MRDPTKGPISGLRKSVENLERLKDSLRMLDLLEKGAADEFVGSVLGREHDIRRAILEANVRDLVAVRKELVAATGEIKPRIDYNGPAREMLERLGGEIDYVPATRVRQHNQLVQELSRRWVEAVRSQRQLAEFLVVAGRSLRAPIARVDRNTLAEKIWGAPFVEDLGGDVQNYYYRKARAEGRVFVCLKPSTQGGRSPSR